MQIRRMGIEITDVPVIGTVTVEPDAGKSEGVRIVAAGKAFSVAELNGAIDALMTARDEAVRMSTMPVAGDATGPWRRLEDVPGDIDRVLDKDSDRWDRSPDPLLPGAWICRTDGGTYSGPATNQKYAPFTVAK